MTEISGSGEESMFKPSYLLSIVVMLALTPSSDAAMFGFGSFQGEIWEEIRSTLFTALSPNNLLLLAIVLYARRRRQSALRGMRG